MGKNLLVYAGIGSRETPEPVLQTMHMIGQQLAPMWTLRSGFAEGADTAFMRGAEQAHGEMEVYLPWSGFNGAPKDHPSIIVPEFTSELLVLAARYHPAWGRCSLGAKKLHARNGCQVLGRDLSSPSHMVICWTPNGRAGGGTGQAIRIARDHDVPVFDLAIPGVDRKLCEYVTHMEKLAQGEQEQAA